MGYYSNGDCRIYSKNIIPKLGLYGHYQFNKALYLRGEASYGFPISLKQAPYEGGSEMRPYRKQFECYAAVGGIRLFSDFKDKETTIVLDERFDGHKYGHTVTKVYYKRVNVKFSKA